MRLSDWYVLQTKSGREKDVLAALKRRDYQAFVPMRTMLERKDGKLQEVKHLLIPGYVFLKLTLCAHAYYAIKQMNGVIKFLGTGMPETVPQAEVRHMLLEDDGIHWSISEGHLEGDALVIDSGPLLEWQDVIQNYDKRQNRATITFTVLGKTHEIDLAVRIKSSSKGKTDDASPPSPGSEQIEEEAPEP